MLGRRRTEVLAGVASIVAVCAAVTVYFAQPLFGPRTVQAVTEHGGDPDVANLFQPLHEYQYRYLRRHGVLPEWIEPMGLGVPEIDLATTTNAYLPRLAVMRAAPSAQSAADILAWVASIVGALGILALARLYRLSWAAAVLAAASYPLSHAAVRWLPYFSLPIFMAAFPFVLLGIELVWRRRLLLGGAVAVAALGIGGLGGSVLFPALAVQVAASLIFYRLVVTRVPPRERILRTAAGGAVLALGLVTASAGWLPFALSQHDTVRTATTFDAIGGIDWTTLRSLVDPAAQVSSEGINGDLYVSVAAPFLLGLGIVLSVRRRMLGFLPLYALLLLLLGLKTPVLRVLIAFVPGWEYLSSAERYVSFLAPLPLALLVGVGADGIVRAGRRGVAAATAMVAGSLLLWQVGMRHHVGWSGWVLAVGVLTAVGLGAAAASRTRWRVAAAFVPVALLPVVVAGSLEERIVGWHPVRNAPDAIYTPWLGLVAAHDDPDGRWMSYCQPLEYALDPRQSFTYRPNTFLNAPGLWLDTYVSFPRPDYYTYWQRLTRSNRYSGREFGTWFQHTPSDPPPSLSLVNAAGVSRVLGSTACERPTPSSWRELASAQATPTTRRDIVYANSAAYPMAYVSHRWKVVRGRDEMIRQLAAAANSRFEAHVDYVQSAAQPATGGSPIPARLERASGTLLRIFLPPSTRSGLLVVLDLYDANWRAYVDGRRSPLVRVNGVFRGVFVSGGARTVTFRYEPWWTRWLFPLCWSLIAVAVSVAVVAAARRATAAPLPTGRIVSGG
jgi:hypothetical protein